MLETCVNNLVETCVNNSMCVCMCVCVRVCACGGVVFVTQNLRQRQQVLCVCVCVWGCANHVSITSWESLKKHMLPLLLYVHIFEFRDSIHVL